MSGQKTFDISKVALIVGGFPIEFETLEVETPEGFSKRVGTQGEVAWSKINDDTAQVTITTLQTAASNLILDQLYEADRNSPGGITYNIMIKDILGTTLFSCTYGRLIKKPALRFSGDIEEREWLFDCSQSKSVIGGN
jgi:hypothetical protein